MPSWREFKINALDAEGPVGARGEDTPHAVLFMRPAFAEVYLPVAGYGG